MEARRDRNVIDEVKQTGSFTDKVHGVERKISINSAFVLTKLSDAEARNIIVYALQQNWFANETCGPLRFKKSSTQCIY